jgi:hypothetical protein
VLAGDLGEGLKVCGLRLARLMTSIFPERDTFTILRKSGLKFYPQMRELSDEVRSCFMRVVAKDKGVGTFKKNVFPLMKKPCLKKQA